jgi:predicted peptidase
MQIAKQTSSLNYLLYTPPQYQAINAHPLILFLHGAGERGSDLDLLKLQPLPQKLETQDLPFVVVSPQCPLGSAWLMHMDDLEDLLDEVIPAYKIDPDHVYLTGISMGGFGTWQLAVRDPNRFAAIAPICGGWPWLEMDDRLCALKDMPIWAFHGELDPVVPVDYTLRAVDAVRDCGGEPLMTIYPDLEHDSWTRTYANPDLYAWFLSQSLAD